MYKKLYKVGIWGQYGDGGPIADGQAVRTTITTEELIKRYGKEEILILNTNAWRKHPVKFFADTVGLLKKSRNVLILPADNGLKVVSVVYDIFNRFYRRNIYYIVIGGFLPTFLKKNPSYVKKLNRYQALFVQTPNLKNDLEALGVKHIEMMTNFKVQAIRSKDDIRVNTDHNIRLCILSRLTKDKGIEDAVEAVKIVNRQLGADRVHLDLYGIVPDAYKGQFDALTEENKDIVSYRGVAKFNETAAVLQGYFAMLFPTYFHGEGFAGCLIDAFFAGIPVIATDWLYNGDVIENGKNGILVEAKNPESIAEAILKLYHDRELARQMSIHNAEKATEYTAEQVLKGLYNHIDSVME